MIDLKYNIDEINLIYDNVSDEFLDSVILKEYVYDIVRYLKVDIFKEEYLSRYKAYFNGNYSKTVLYVNIGLDKDFYTDVDTTSVFSTTMLVNKYHGVSKDLVVPNLVKLDSECSNGDNYLNSEAAEMFVKLCKAAKKEGYSVLANYTYRDFETQQSIWDQYLKLYGQKYNDKYVTKPGFSEHHTGLAIDVKSGNFDVFKNSKEYNWMLDNSYKYGYIHRYQSSKEAITGISSEAWHFRYVGVDVATYMYENKLSFEEYYALFLDK
jgi:D-alanyl-D-alanine carboxypeptidase